MPVEFFRRNFPVRNGTMVHPKKATCRVRDEEEREFNVHDSVYVD